MTKLNVFPSLLLALCIMGIGGNAEASVPINSVNFPDAVLRNYVSTHFDANADNELSDAEIAVADSINLYKSHCSSLKGIEWLTALKHLNCSVNGLTEVDVSHNAELRYLNVYSTYVSKLNLSGNAKLEKLVCSYAALDSLDVSACVNLVELNCQLNKISKLDVSHCPELSVLNCATNSLKALDVSKNAKLRELYVFDNKLTALGIDSNAKLVLLNCTGNKLDSLDVSHNSRLTSLYCSENNLRKLDVSKNRRLSLLMCASNELTQLDVSGCAYLSAIDCSHNDIADLDVSQNADVVSINCSYNMLRSLDVSHNIDYLSTLKCDGNQLASLDLSHNKKLATLSASENARSIPVSRWVKSPGDTIAFVPVDSLSAILGGGFDFAKLNQTSITGGNIATHADGRKILAFSGSELKYDYSTGCTSSSGASTVTFTLRADGGGTPSSGIDEVADAGKQLLSLAYYSIGGTFAGYVRPTSSGVYVQVCRYADGSARSTKVLIK